MGMEDTTEQKSGDKQVHEDHAGMGEDMEDSTGVGLNPESPSNQLDMERLFYCYNDEMGPSDFGLGSKCDSLPSFPMELDIFTEKQMEVIYNQ